MRRVLSFRISVLNTEMAGALACSGDRQWICGLQWLKSMWGTPGELLDKISAAADELTTIRRRPES